MFTAHLEGVEGVAEHRSTVTAATADLERFRQRATQGWTDSSNSKAS